jgi:glycosyltransferase involved in cell wall biosynthesis
LDAYKAVLPGDVSVVICAYTLRRWNDTEAAVESVLQQEPCVREVVLVIDHSPELFRAAVERWRAHENVLVIPSRGVRGLSGARDTGVHEASGAVVAFLDDDAAAGPEWAATLAGAYQDDSVLGVGGGIDPWWPEGRPSWWPPEFDWVVGCSYRGQPVERSPVRNVIGANMSFRRDVLLKVGGFDPRVGRVGADHAGGEETELCIRARTAFPGAEVLLEPSARVRHRVAPDRATWKYFRRRCYGEGMTKARVGQLAGHEAATSTERVYVLRTLPVGMARGLFSSDPRRGFTVVAGLLWATVAYVRTAVKR